MNKKISGAIRIKRHARWKGGWAIESRVQGWVSGSLTNASK